MARIASTLLVLALLGGTAVAFAITETRKLQPTPILGTRVEKVFSPVCECDDPVAEIGFRVRKQDTVSTTIVRGGKVVRRLGEIEALAGETVEFVWDGLDDRGGLLPEGEYHPRVHLRRARRTIELPNPIRLDSTKPQVELTAVRPQVFSPDGDRRRDRISVAFESSEPARAFLYVNGKQRVASRFPRTEDKLEWFGKVGGKAVRPGTYRLAVEVVDQAGNRSKRTGEFFAHVRYIRLARELKVVRARVRFGIRVETDAAAYRWRFAGARGSSGEETLVLRAPRKPGFYTLFVEANGHADKATIAVRKAL